MKFVKLKKSNNMKDLEILAEEYVQGVVNHNPELKTAENAIATAVVYGYQMFDRPWFNNETFNFGAAIHALKLGMKVRRKNWNGKGMFLWLKPATVIKAEWCKDPMLKELAERNSGEISALGTICMFTAQGEILTGWLASQTDILSEDWEIVNNTITKKQEEDFIKLLKENFKEESSVEKGFLRRAL